LKGCLIVLAIPVALVVLSAIASFVAAHGGAILSVILFVGAIALGALLVRSIVHDFRKSGGSFDGPDTIIFFAKLFSLVGLSITTIVVLVNLFR
jgi:hypothetical protein